MEMNQIHVVQNTTQTNTGEGRTEAGRLKIVNGCMKKRSKQYGFFSNTVRDKKL